MYFLIHIKFRNSDCYHYRPTAFDPLLRLLFGWLFTVRTQKIQYLVSPSKVGVSEIQLGAWDDDYQDITTKLN